MTSESWILFITILTGGIDLQEGKHPTVESCIREGVEKIAGRAGFGFACADHGSTGYCIEISQGSRLQVCDNAVALDGEKRDPGT